MKPIRGHSNGRAPTQAMPDPSTKKGHCFRAINAFCACWRSTGQARLFDYRSDLCRVNVYTFPDTQSIVDFLEQGQSREEYGRYGNPGERVVEDKLAAIDSGEASVLFSSGMAAFVGLLMAHVDAGDDIIFFDECYHRSREFCRRHLTRFGVGFREVRTCDYEAMEAAITPRNQISH